MEAPPIELLSGADLVREAEIVRPAFLLGAPSATPTELEYERGAVRARLDRTDEIGTARGTRNRHAANGQLRLRRQHVL